MLRRCFVKVRRRKKRLTPASARVKRYAAPLSDLPPASCLGAPTSANLPCDRDRGWDSFARCDDDFFLRGQATTSFVFLFHLLAVAGAGRDDNTRASPLMATLVPNSSPDFASPVSLVCA
jgi:hypothetical protein